LLHPFLSSFLLFQHRQLAFESIFTERISITAAPNRRLNLIAYIVPIQRIFRYLIYVF
jgi:hypothetical protein